jgi:glucose/mannose-6-phosphate isomerase
MNELIDKERLILVLENFPNQIRDANTIPIPEIKPFSSLTICGMGGSGLPGEIIKCIIPDKLITNVKNYTIPKHTAQDTLVIVVSYSGNTEESLAAYDEAIQKKLQTIALSSGGKLQERAVQNNIPHIKVPTPHVSGASGFQPRMAVGYQTIPLLRMLTQQDAAPTMDWNEVATFLEKEKESIKQQAKEMAVSIEKKIPLIYASQSFYACAYKWKKNFNENAKIPAFSNYFPEFNHNEINAYQYAQQFTIFIIRDSDDDNRIKKRMDAVAQIAEQNDVQTTTINSKGRNKIERILWTIYLGDWLSYYTAINNNIDPTPVTVIQGFKQMLN